MSKSVDLFHEYSRALKNVSSNILINDKLDNNFAIYVDDISESHNVTTAHIWIENLKPTYFKNNFTRFETVQIYSVQLIIRLELIETKIQLTADCYFNPDPFKPKKLPYTQIGKIIATGKNRITQKELNTSLPESIEILIQDTVSKSIMYYR